MSLGYMGDKGTVNVWTLYIIRIYGR